MTQFLSWTFSLRAKVQERLLIWAEFFKEKDEISVLIKENTLSLRINLKIRTAISLKNLKDEMIFLNFFKIK